MRRLPPSFVRHGQIRKLMDHRGMFAVLAPGSVLGDAAEGGRGSPRRGQRLRGVCNTRTAAGNVTFNIPRSALGD